MRLLATLIDCILAPFAFLAARVLGVIRKRGVRVLPRSWNALMDAGVFPILRHYYEPQFDNRNPRVPFSQERVLPGIDWNVAGQLEFIGKLNFAHELSNIPNTKNDPPTFHFNNGMFESGDAEYWYQIIRAVKPKRIIEIGSGNSTLLAIKAITQNSQDDHSYSCEHTCIEPYEMPWLERTGIKIVRKKVEELPLSFFSDFERNDILFIDSSHVIRPQGDVLFEYLELLPSLRSGVIVHIHDIFSPRNYLDKWLREDVLLWNEQYLLEAFLSGTTDWKIIGALNLLHHHHYAKLKEVAPYLEPAREPGSFYIQKI